MRYTITLDGGGEVELTRDVHDPILEVGEKVHLSFNGDVVNVFDSETENSVMKDVIGR